MGRWVSVVVCVACAAPPPAVSPPVTSEMTDTEPTTETDDEDSAGNDSTPNASHPPLSDWGPLSLPVIDVHAHPYALNKDGARVIDDGTTMQVAMTRQNIGTALAWVPLQSKSTAFVASKTVQLAAEVPQVVPILAVDPSAKDAVTAAETGLRDSQFAGLAVFPSWTTIAADDAQMDPLVDLAVDYDVPIIVHTGSEDWASPARAGTLAGRHPDATIILYDVGANPRQATAISVLNSRSNVWMETSGLDVETVAGLIDLVGIERLMFGTQVSTGGLQHYTTPWDGDVTWDNVIDEAGRVLSTDELRALTVRNAVEVFRLHTVHIQQDDGMPVLRIDRGHGMGEVVSMVPEGVGWWRKTFPGAWSNTLEIDGSRVTIEGWEVWIDDNVPIPTPPTTTLTATFDPGPDVQMTVRGRAYPLHWGQGTPAVRTKADQWTLTVQGVVEPLAYKWLASDKLWESGPDHMVKPGETADVVPVFK
ncbi:MAG: amidohydrolase family protein [Myxococcota bacterium]